MNVLAETPATRFTAPPFAPRPAEARGVARDEVRLLVGTPDGLEHTRFRELPDHLHAGDVLVVNTSATVAGEVDATMEGRRWWSMWPIASTRGPASWRCAPLPMPTGRPSSPAGRGNRL